MTEAVVTNAPALGTQRQSNVSPRLENRSPWWRGAVIYQIYPRSFFDANGDGIGDLRGILEKLDYVASLGVDAIWVSPFFRSPMKDFGYDVSDYRSVDPIFGDLSDFDALISAAHQRGLKVIIDQVLSHSSDQHAWFQESRRGQDNPYANWYVWADPKPDGTPPNNWLSIFGGSAWQWESQRQQYYLHNFLSSQPDLNYHEPAVVDRMLSELRFWLERGVDGFRLDAINFCYHDHALRDNPAKPETARRGRGFRTDNPYAWQRHVFDNTRPENLFFLERIRRLCDEYGDIATLGEITAEDPVATMLEYTRGNTRLHMAYNFELLVDEFSLDHIRDAVEDQERHGAEGWPCRAIGNHDVARVATRWANGSGYSAERVKLLNTLLLTLRGTVCTYQGEELGLTEATISREQVRDPYGIEFWPNFKGRDGCRTPMPWTGDSISAGFSTAKPWLPTPSEHRRHSIREQQSDDDSVLNAYRTFVDWRSLHPALRWGGIDFIDTPENTLAFRRFVDDEQILCVFNFQSSEAAIELDPAVQLTSLHGHGLTEGVLRPGSLTLPGYGAAFLRIAP
ncbi:MAG: alpha-glucosidase [Pseudomonadota bacterium]